MCSIFDIAKDGEKFVGYTGGLNTHSEFELSE